MRDGVEATQEEEAVTGTVEIPAWAVALVGAFLGLLILYLRWSLKNLHDLATGRLERIDTTVHEIDRRVVRIETILDAAAPSTPAAARIRVLTPPTGVPIT